MATFVDVKQASGYIKTKAVCRVWRNGKQVSKCKTFDTRQSAESWAADIERTMKVMVGEEKLDGLRKPVNKHMLSTAVTVGDLQDIYHLAHAHISVIAEQPLLLVSVNTFTQYFEKRNKDGASIDEMKVEADLLYSMFRYRDETTGRRDASLVQMALTALRARGLID